MKALARKSGSIMLQFVVSIIFVVSFVFSVLFAGVIYVMRCLKIFK